MVCTTVYLKGVATVSALFYVYSLGLTAHFDLNKITGSKNIYYQANIYYEICIHPLLSFGEFLPGYVALSHHQVEFIKNCQNIAALTTNSYIAFPLSVLSVRGFWS